MVAYQNILKLSYVDKFLNEIQLRFRDKYKQEIESGRFNHDFSGFKSDFNSILKECEAEARASLQQQQQPKSYQASAKSQTTVGSMVEKNKPTMLGNLISSISSSTTTSNTKVNSSVEATKDKHDADSDSGCEAGSDGVASNNFDDSKMKSLSLGDSGGVRRQGKFVPKK